MTHTDTLTPTEVIDLDAVVTVLRAKGIDAYVEQTGGGTATIYAGTPWQEEGWGNRYPAIAGPGWFDGPHFTIGRALATDFYIGADDDGEGDTFTAVGGTNDPATIADAIAAQVARTAEERNA